MLKPLTSHFVVINDIIKCILNTNLKKDLSLNIVYTLIHWLLFGFKCLIMISIKLLFILNKPTYKCTHFKTKHIFKLKCAMVCTHLKLQTLENHLFALDNFTCTVKSLY